MSVFDRNIVKFNLTSGTLSLQEPGIFLDVLDVKYFNASRGMEDVYLPQYMYSITTYPWAWIRGWTGGHVPLPYFLKLRGRPAFCPTPFPPTFSEVDFL